MKKFFDIITFGAITQDIMFYTDEAKLIKDKKDPWHSELIAFVYGSKIRSDKVNFTFGGGGGNTAVSFSKLGLRISSVVRVGLDRIGDAYLKNFKENKIDISLVQKDTTCASGFSFIINYGDYNEHVIFAYRGANENLKIDLEKLKKVKTKWYYLASLPKSNLNNNLNKIFESAAGNKIKIAWNPGVSELNKGERGLKKYLQKTHVLIVNKNEARELAKSAGKNLSSIKDLLRTLWGFGPRVVAISQGHLGAYLYDGKQIFYERALPFVPLNTTGAGDAFGSSLVAGLILFKNDLRKSLQLAMIRSNYVIQKIGAQVGLLNKNASLKLLKKYGDKKSKT